MAAFGQQVTIEAARTDTVVFSIGSSVVTDTSVAATDLGRAVTGTGIPAGSTVGTVTASTSFILLGANGLPTTPTANGTSITMGASLVFQIVDGITYAANGYTQAANPNIFKAGTDNDPLPLLIVLPASTHIFFGGVGVTASSTGVGADFDGVPSLAYNAVGGDSLYAVVSSSTATLMLLALRQ